MPGWRIALYALGITLLVVAVASPIAAVGEEELFSFHMAQHLILGDLAPLCLLAGLTGPILRPILALPGVMRLRVLANPFVAFPIWAANLVLWHLPVLYEGAVESSALHALEHVAFFSAGIVLWLPVLETLPAPEWFGTGAKLAYIVGVRLVATVVGNVFIWGGSAFYDVYETGDDFLGLSPDADQSLAGSLMMLEGSLVTIVALAWLFLRMAQEGEVRQELLEGVDERTARRAVRYRRWSELTYRLEFRTVSYIVECMSAFARLVSGRRSKFVVLALWIGALVALGPLIGQFESKQRNEPSSFLPEDAESVRALELSDQFPSAEGVAAIAIFSRSGGLTDGDREAIAGIRPTSTARDPKVSSRSARRNSPTTARPRSS